MYLGLILKKQGKYEEAAKLLEELVQHEPEKLDMHLHLAEARVELGQFDKAEILEHEHALYQRAYDGVRGVNGLTVHGTAKGKGAVLSFSIDGAHPHDLAQIMDRYGVAVRAGHHCAQPLMEHMGVSATARASFAVYNTEAEVDAFIEALHKARGMLI